MFYNAAVDVMFIIIIFDILMQTLTNCGPMLSFFTFLKTLAWKGSIVLKCVNDMSHSRENKKSPFAPVFSFTLNIL